MKSPYHWGTGLALAVAAPAAVWMLGTVLVCSRTGISPMSILSGGLRALWLAQAVSLVLLMPVPDPGDHLPRHLVTAAWAVVVTIPHAVVCWLTSAVGVEGILRGYLSLTFLSSLIALTCRLAVPLGGRAPKLLTGLRLLFAMGLWAGGRLLFGWHLS